MIRAGKIIRRSQTPATCARHSRGHRDNGAVRLLVLGAGPPQLGVLAAARRRGLTVVAADRDPSAPGFKYADRRAIVSIEDEPAIDRLARAEEVDGLVAPGTDHAVAIAARVAQRLGVPHPLSPEAAALSVSRLRQREKLAAAGFAQPRSTACRTAAEAAAAAGELGYPLVVEAPNSLGERSGPLGSRAPPTSSPRRPQARSRRRAATTASSRSCSVCGPSP